MPCRQIVGRNPCVLRGASTSSGFVNSHSIRCRGRTVVGVKEPRTPNPGALCFSPQAGRDGNRPGGAHQRFVSTCRNNRIACVASRRTSVY